MYCDGTSLIVAEGCGDDDTCGSCGVAIDYTAVTGGMYYCDDDDNFYSDEDLDGTPEYSSPAPGCLYNEECDGDDDDGDDDDCDDGYENVYCDDGHAMVQNNCGDDGTCGDCDGAIDYTEATGGVYSCDDDTGMYYVDYDLDGDAEESDYIPGCHQPDACDDDDDYQCVDSDWTYKGKSSKDCDW